MSDADDLVSVRVSVVFAQGPAMEQGGWCVEIVGSDYEPVFFGPFPDKQTAIQAQGECLAVLSGARPMATA